MAVVDVFVPIDCCMSDIDRRRLCMIVARVCYCYCYCLLSRLFMWDCCCLSLNCVFDEVADASVDHPLSQPSQWLLKRSFHLARACVRAQVSLNGSKLDTGFLIIFCRCKSKNPLGASQHLSGRCLAQQSRAPCQ